MISRILEPEGYEVLNAKTAKQGTRLFDCQGMQVALATGS